jgi:hypothetical protein
MLGVSNLLLNELEKEEGTRADPFVSANMEEQKYLEIAEAVRMFDRVRHLHPDFEADYRKRARQIALEMGITPNTPIKACFWQETPLTIDGRRVPLRFLSSFEVEYAQLIAWKRREFYKLWGIELVNKSWTDTLYNMPKECIELQFDGIFT